MFRTYRAILTLLIAISVSRLGWSAPPEEIREMLTRAEALYYEANFTKAVELLLSADEMLREQPDLLAEKVAVKIQTALAYVGLNNADRAKTYLGELYALDPNYKIDPQLFSPKVIRLADEARTEQEERRCRELLAQAQGRLAEGNGDAVVRLIGASQAKCSGLSALSSKAADLIFKDGLESYKKAQMGEALEKFRAALAMAPNHELAVQYIDLTEGKLEISAERALLAWRKDFTAGEFAMAARGYHELKAMGSPGVIDEVQVEYRQALSGLVEAWNRACAMDDRAGMEKLRVQVNALLPEPSLGEDLLANMKTCAPAGCIRMDTQLALARLKTRVEPQVHPALRAQIRVSPVTVRLKIRVNEQGSVINRELQGGHPLLYGALRAAVDQWQFHPAVTEFGARCMETEIPFVFTFQSGS